MLKGRLISLKTAEKEDLPEIYKIVLEDGMGGAFSTTYYENTLSNLHNLLFETENGTQSKAFVIKLKEKTIGFITLNDIHPIRRSAAIGNLGILKEYQKKNEKSFLNTSYAIEAGGILMIYAFEILNLHKLTASTFSDNSNVDKLYLNGGWTKEGISRDYIPRNGKWLDKNEWGILRIEYDNHMNYKKLKEFINWK